MKEYDYWVLEIEASTSGAYATEELAQSVADIERVKFGRVDVYKRTFKIRETLEEEALINKEVKAAILARKAADWPDEYKEYILQKKFFEEV